MTRNELVEKVYNALPPSCRTLQANENAFIFVDSLIAVGLLKFDEPKSAEDKFCDAYHGAGNTQTMGSSIRKALERAGLKIVEK